MDSSDLIYAYLAGAIDADGFITIARSTPSATRKDGRRSTYYTAKIGLSETSPVIPDLLQNTFGGWRGGHTPKNPAHRPWFIWQVTNHQAACVARSLLPYLRLKRQQAELLLAFAARVKPGVHLSSTEIQERESLYFQVTALNQPRNRRVHPLTPRLDGDPEPKSTPLLSGS